MKTPDYISPDGTVTLYCADCREILPHLSGVDAIITDPPYGISYDGSHSKYRNGIDHGHCEWDVEEYDPAPVLALDKPTIMWGGNCFSSRLPDMKSWAVWVKIVRQNADIRQSDCELAWTNCLGRNRVFNHLWVGAYRDSESGIRNVHPTQKPIALMVWCVDLLHKYPCVLDPYMGSGTTGVACVRRGRPFVGIERDAEHFRSAVKRIEQAFADQALFAPQPVEVQSELFAEVT